MKKIALILSPDSVVPAIKGGAVEELVTILIEENEKKKEVELVVFAAEDRDAKKISEQYRYTKIISIPKASVLDRVINRILRYINRFYSKKTLLDVAHYRKAFRILRNTKIDAIVAEGGMYHEFRRFSEEYGKEKLYLHIHHHLLCEPNIDYLFGNAIGISEFVVNEWNRTSKDEDIETYVVKNCVNESKFSKKIMVEERQRIRSEFDFEEEDMVLLYCGRILEVKGVRELLLAMKKIDNPRIKLLIIGNVDFAANTKTTYLEEIEDLVNQMKDKVKFTGYIENQNLYQYYQSVDLQVIPSLWEEAAGLVAIEGMLSGLPLIVTRTGGLIEYAPSNVALWVEREGIVNNLVDSIQMLYGNPEKREKMSKASLEHAKLFTKEDFYRNYLQVFEK